MPLTIRSIQYYGGKGNLVDWVIANLPGGTVYVEPFGGAAWVLLNKPRHPIEVYNDLDNSMVTLFRVIQDKRKFAELRRRLHWTLYSYHEFRKACDILNSPDGHSDIDIAWARYVHQMQGFSGSPSSGSWGRELKYGGHRLTFFPHRKNQLPKMHARLERVFIDARDAFEVIRYWDSPDTVFYLDPPYPLQTRSRGDAYTYEMTDERHELLIELLSGIRGSFALSSYPNPLYDRLVERGIATCITRQTHAHSIGRTRALQNKGIIGTAEWREKSTRIEALYIKGAPRGQLRMF